MCYLFAPIILVWFGGAMFFGYKLDAKRHAEIREALAAHDVAAAEESLIGPTANPRKRWSPRNRARVPGRGVALRRCAAPKAVI